MDFQFLSVSLSGGFVFARVCIFSRMDRTAFLRRFTYISPNRFIDLGDQSFESYFFCAELLES